MLTNDQAVERVRMLQEFADAERPRLERVRGYYKGDQRLRFLTDAVPAEVRRIADISRVNVVRLVVNAVVQSLFIEGYRTPLSGADEPAWAFWQRNRMDSRQTGVHRAASVYGAAYITVLPGDPVPVLRGSSPRQMTTVFGSDDDWPELALERRRSGTSGSLWRLFDATHAYWVAESPDGPSEVLRVDEHGVGVCPVVRMLDTDDLDDPVTGEVEPLIQVQDQINLTTFGMLVAQQYGAFRQRYILGWLAETEQQKLKASASRLWTFEDHPDDVKIGEFEQTNLDGFIESREASIRHMAVMSQTPVNELAGQLANLSAEALVAARDSNARKLKERQAVRGEAWEQALSLAADIAGEPSDPEAWVRWADTDSRSLSQTADALGKLADQLGIPRRSLWERAAAALGASQQEVESWAEAAAEEDSFGLLSATLDRQAGPAVPIG